MDMFFLFHDEQTWGYEGLERKKERESGFLSFPAQCDSVILCWVAEKAVYEFASVEHLQLVDAFADADITDRNFKLVADSDHDAAFGRSVEFGDGQGGNLGCLDELFGLFESILSS